jgi:hypothetical protein
MTVSKSIDIFPVCYMKLRDRFLFQSKGCFTKNQTMVLIVSPKADLSHLEIKIT